MSMIITRGTSCRLVFHVHDLDVTTLGTPHIAIAQELAFVTPISADIDEENNTVYADFLPQDTIQLVDGWETKAQLAFTGDYGSVIEFPVHYIEVRPSIFGAFYELDVTQTEYEIVEEEVNE